MAFPSRPSYPYNLLQALGSFWNRSFADRDLFRAVHEDAAAAAGQTYLDLLETVLVPSLRTCPLWSRQYLRLVNLREDQGRWEALPQGIRVSYDLDPDIVQVPALDNRVVGTSATLELGVDYEEAGGTLSFRVDPLDQGTQGLPVAGFARRRLQVVFPTAFDDPHRVATFGSWRHGGVRKGDVLRLLTQAMAPIGQGRREDLTVALVRDGGLYFSIPATTRVADPVASYVVLRKGPSAQVLREPLTFVAGAAALAHGRLEYGSLQVIGRRTADGTAVVEGRDYLVDYEAGMVFQLAPFALGAVQANYVYFDQVLPSTPGMSVVGGTLLANQEEALWELGAWAPDVRLDRRYLSEAYGALVGVEAPSTEAYRAFLQGVVNLYVSGPVLTLMESALTSLLGLPVADEDGELFVGFEVLPSGDYEVSTLPSSGVLRRYDVPAKVALARELLDPAAPSVLRLRAGQPLADAVHVVDYLSSPAWFYGKVIPRELFSDDDVSEAWPLERRVISPEVTPNIIDAADGACIDDPGLFIDADDEGRVWPAGAARRGAAFVLFDRVLKYHVFQVAFSDGVLDPDTGLRFAGDPRKVTDIINAVRPSHTFPYVQPSTDVRDVLRCVDVGWYQPNPDKLHGPDVFPTTTGLDPGRPSVLLGVQVGALEQVTDEVGLRDCCLRIDDPYTFVDDWFLIEEVVIPLTDFFVGGPVGVIAPDVVPVRSRVLRLRIDVTVGGKPLLEGVNYVLDTARQALSPLTPWDHTTASGIALVLRLVNQGVTAPDEGLGYTPLIIDGVSPIERTPRPDLAVIERPVIVVRR